MQKVISCKAEEVKDKINPLLEKYWEIIHVIAEPISTSVAITGGSFNHKEKSTERGLIVFVLKK